jgi:hypothetical protein
MIKISMMVEEIIGNHWMMRLLLRLLKAANLLKVQEPLFRKILR